MAEDSGKTAGLLEQLFGLAASIVNVIRGVLTGPGNSEATEGPVSGEGPQRPLTLPIGEPHAEAAQILTQHTPGWHTPRPATLPVPTYAPAMAAFGILFIALGAATRWPLSVVGAGIFLLAIAKWIGELLHD